MGKLEYNEGSPLNPFHTLFLISLFFLPLTAILYSLYDEKFTQD